MKIYGDLNSGNCLKVKWTCDVLKRPYTWVDIDTMKGQSRTPEFLKLNPAGQVPVVELDDGRVLAGGQSLVPTMAFRLARPKHLVDINGVAGLDRLVVENGRLCIGAAVRHAAFETPVEDGPLGRLLVAATGRGVCSVAMGASDGELERSLTREYPAAVVRKDNRALAHWVDTVVAHLAGRLDEWLALDVADRSTDLGDDHVGLRVLLAERAGCL